MKFTFWVGAGEKTDNIHKMNKILGEGGLFKQGDQGKTHYEGDT